MSSVQHGSPAAVTGRIATGWVVVVFGVDVVVVLVRVVLVLMVAVPVVLDVPVVLVLVGVVCGTDVLELPEAVVVDTGGALAVVVATGAGAVLVVSVAL